jgi:hypothetical protein
MLPDQTILAKIKVGRLYQSADGVAVRVIKIDYKRNLVICRNYDSHSNQAFELDKASASFVRLYKIGDVAKMFGKKSSTIRKYESEGLLPQAKKIALNGDGRAWTRVYSPSDIEMLQEFFDRRKPVGRPGPANVPGIDRNAIKVKIDASYLKGRYNG